MNRVLDPDIKANFDTAEHAWISKFLGRPRIRGTGTAPLPRLLHRLERGQDVAAYRASRKRSPVMDGPGVRGSRTSGSGQVDDNAAFNGLDRDQ